MSTTLGTTHTLPLDTLRPRGGNPRRGNIEAIRRSLQAHGQFKPIVVNRTSTGHEIIAGNHTAQAARQLGWETIQAHVLEVDEDTARKIMLADNRTSDLATYELNALAQELAALDDLEGTGYAAGDLQAIMDVMQDDETPQPADDNDGVYPYEGTRTLTLRLVEPLHEQWEQFAFPFDSPEEALEYLLDHHTH